MAVTIDGTTGITTPGLTNTGVDTLVDLTTTGNTVIGNATTDTLVVGVNGIVKDTFGNVGIGTNTFSTKLSFGAYVPSNGQTVSIYENGNSKIGLGIVAGAYRIYTSQGAVTSFGEISSSDGTTFTERMRIDTSGNVGIGTTSPSYFVQANKNQNAETGFAMFNTNNSASASVGFYQKVYNASGYLNGQETQYLTYGGAYSGTPLSGAPIVFGRAGTFSGMWDSSGNLGIGVTPSAWPAGYNAIQFGTSTRASAIFTNGVNDLWLTSNMYYNGTNWIYNYTGTATAYEQITGTHKWYIVGSGTAAATATLTQAMTLDVNGNLLVGSTNSYAVNGNAAAKQFVASSGANGSTVLRYNGFGTYGAILNLATSAGAALGTYAGAGSGNGLGSIFFGGDNGTNYTGTGAVIRATASETWTTSTNAAYLSFDTTTSGSIAATEKMRIDSSGNVGIGSTNLTSYNLRISKTLTGTTTVGAVFADSAIQSDVTVTANGFQTNLSTQAAAFTLGGIQHFTAGQSTIGAASAVTSQYGFIATSSLTGATNNYGFYGNIAAPTSGITTTGTITSISSSTTTVTVNHNAITYTNGQTVTISATANATALVSGATCTILTVGTTDFTLIGAASNTVGVSFTATGAGTGTGTVTLNVQGSGKTVAGAASGSFTYTTTTSQTFAAVTVLTGSVTVSNRCNLYMAGTADNYIAGNLGIGTSSPSYKLDINTGVAGVVQRWNTNSVSMLAEADHLGNGNWFLSPQGTATFNVKTGGSTRLTVDSSGNVGIGVTPSAGQSLVVGKTITGAVISYGALSNGTVQSDVSTAGIGFQTSLSTQATAFTLPNLSHFAASQATIGSTSVVTSQYGFVANSNLTGATNNYGFYGNIASGTSRYNLYMNGTADNYLAGNLGIGITPNAWVTFKGIQIGTANPAFIVGRTDSNPQVAVGVNMWFNGTNWVYTAASSQVASRYLQTAGAHQWFYSSAGTAGNTVAETQAMTLDASGSLLLGTTSSVTPWKQRTIGAVQSLQLSNTESNTTDKYSLIAGMHYTNGTYSDGVAIIGHQSTPTANKVSIGGFFSEARAATQVDFYTAAGTGTQSGTLRMSIDSSGNVGIGVTPAANFGLLQVGTSTNGTAAYLGNGAGVHAFNSTGYYSSAVTLSSAGTWTARSTAAGIFGASSTGIVQFFTDTGLTSGNTFSPTERMRIDSVGNLLVGTTSASTPSTTGYASVANTFGFKNRLINGAMVISQRGTSAVTQTTTPAYTVDRWNIYGTVTSKYTAQQNSGAVTPPAGYINYLGIVSSSAYTVGTSERYEIRQAIEGLNVADLAWGTASAATVTLSFWVRSSLTGTFGGIIQNNANDRTYPYTYTISTANTWEQKTVTIAGDTSGTWLTTNSVGIYVQFSMGAGATYSGTAGAWTGTANIFSATGAVQIVATNAATWYVTGVQVEKGSTATSFDYRPYGTEYQLCQRYYQQVNNTAGVELGVGLFTAQSATLAYANYFWVVPLRASPTCAITGNMQWTVTGGQTTVTPTTVNPNTYSVLLQLAVSGLTAGQCGRLTIASGASGLLTASAEL
jgi:hypothetical protein